MKILVTGAHTTPALAFVHEAKNGGHSIVYVGRKYAQEADSTLSFEYNEVVALGVPFVDLSTGRATRTLNLRSMVNILRIPLGLFRALRIVSAQKPDVVMSFGGYIALPIALAAHAQHIPIFTHEQTIAPGVANQWIARLSRHVFVAFKRTVNEFDPKKTTVVGNPVRADVRANNHSFAFSNSDPVLFITGGTLGSHSVNLLIEALLPQLLARYNIIHQTGDTAQYQDYERLVSHQTDRYIVRKHIASGDIGAAYAAASIVVARAGANTVSELILLKKPAVLIPLPWAARNEQAKHAAYMVEMGVAKMFDQSHAPDELLATVIAAIDEKDAMTSRFEVVEQVGDLQAAARMLQTISSSITAKIAP